MGVTFAIFQSSGTLLDCIDLLKIIGRGSVNAFILSSKILAHISSGPFLNFSIFSFTSVSENRMQKKLFSSVAMFLLSIIKIS